MINTLLEEVTSQAVSGINEDVVQKHWETIIGTKQLEPDETIRLVIMPGANSKIAQSAEFKKTTGAWTDKNQIRNAQELIARMRTISLGEVPGAIGFALSAGVYNFVPNTTPSYNTLKYIQTMIIDIDAHVNDKTKDRFNLSSLDPKYLKFASITMLNYINFLLKENGLNPVACKYAANTGGGFQFGIAFNEKLEKNKARKVFETFGSVLGTTIGSEEKVKKDREINNNIVSQIETVSTNELIGNEIIEKEGDYAARTKKGLKIQVKTLLGDWSNPFFEIDNSFKDCTHAQRIIGTINQKYECFSYTDNGLCTAQGLTDTIDKIKKEVSDNIHFSPELKAKMHDHFYNSIRLMHAYILGSNPNCNYTLVDTNDIEDLSSIIQTANSLQRHQGSEFISLTEVEKQVLVALKSDKVLEVLGDLGITVVKQSSKYIACRSPFREDSKPSLAIYLNEDRVHIKDFTEDKNYNLITLWMAVNNCTKTEAIEQMAFRYSVKLEKNDKKDFVKLQQFETAMEYIQGVNVVDYIYYRLANKSRSCIIKNVKTSSSVSFDGSMVLSDHVLINQLGCKHPDKDFKKEFNELFERYILIDAFEDFEPGANKTIIDDHVRKVNIWSANESYLKCYEEAEKLEEMKLDEAISLIKDVCPYIYIYLLQITQKGDLKFLVNWLNCLAKFRYIPIIPIFPSVQGAGKNLFATKILAPYLNQQYIAVVNGQQLTNNFNSFMGETNLIISDEGDFSTGTKDFDQLKMLTGNDTVRVEKKGIDTVVRTRKFNICMFTNSEVPIRHPISDRRCVYFKLEHALPHTLRKLDDEEVKTPRDFVKKISEEIHKFWGIIIKTKIIEKWTEENLKNGIFVNQILMMHPFGRLICKILENDWDSIGLQLNERQKDAQEESFNMKLLAEIKENFYAGQPIPLIVINKYLDAMAWKSSTSIQQFLQQNRLHEYGIEIVVTSDSIKIKLDVEKLQEVTHQENNLSEVIPEFKVKPKMTLEELKNEHYKDSKKLANSIIKPVSKMPIPGMSVPVPGGLPSGTPAGLPGGLPSGLPTGLPGGI